MLFSFISSLFFFSFSRALSCVLHVYHAFQFDTTEVSLTSSIEHRAHMYHEKIKLKADNSESQFAKRVRRSGSPSTSTSRQKALQDLCSFLDRKIKNPSSYQQCNVRDVENLKLIGPACPLSVLSSKFNQKALKQLWLVFIFRQGKVPRFTNNATRVPSKTRNLLGTT